MAAVAEAVREHAAAIVALLDAVVSDDVSAIQSQLEGLQGAREQADAASCALAVLQAQTTHPEKGSISVRECAWCHQSFPEWMSTPTNTPCPSCRVRAQSSRSIRHDAPADEAIAAVAHEAMSVHRVLRGWSGYPRWEDAPAEHVAEMITQVRAITTGETGTALQSHDAWMARAKEAGWIYAPTFDPIGRTDPTLRPWSELSERDKENRKLLLSVVHTLSGKQ